MDDNTKVKNTEVQNNSKLNYLNNVELRNSVETEINLKQRKYFITFPYPYMNGKLHLGHLFSITKSDFMAYYKELQGYNVLFPFSFHCTGMPIVALAKKLEEELAGGKIDNSVVNILTQLGFSKKCSDDCENRSENVCTGCVKEKDSSEKIDPIYPFVDPIHWCQTFPPYCKNTLVKIDARIDWRRSFITTSINKYYDSFIEYQFRRLKETGLLVFGKRHSIFCPIDKQICLDHDRQKGEGVMPVNIVCFKAVCDKNVLLVPITADQSKKVDLVNYKIYANKGCKLVRFKIIDKIFYVGEELFDNLKHQVDLTESMPVSFDEVLEIFHFIVNSDKIKQMKISCDGKLNLVEEFEEINKIDSEEMKLIESEHFVRISVPESPVISRSGGLCVVSLTEQWYIDYHSSWLKDLARECVNDMICTLETRQKLLSSIDWISKWGFSRSFGLGTRIPWDPQYLIDSLSDSTIYMAFYTFKHLLFVDMQGNEEIFPSVLLCDEVWDFIFGRINFSKIVSKLNQLASTEKTFPSAISGGKITLEKCFAILESCRNSFSYFYPVDLRTSGKDLTSNHLLFFIFNHVALFDRKNWPKRIFTNGHLLLNSEKMSKSTGNYLTVEDAIRKFGSSATRMCLADCGDANEDANFDMKVANSLVLRLFTFVKTVEETFITRPEMVGLNSLEISGRSKTDLIADEFLLNSIYLNANQTIRNYEKMIFKNVLKFGFYECLADLEKYNSIVSKRNVKLVRYVYTVVVQIIYPLIPSLSRYLAKIIGCSITLPSYFSNPQKKLTEDSLFDVEVKSIKIFEYLEFIEKKIHSCKDVTIFVGSKFADWKLECMQIIDKLRKTVPDSKMKKTILSETSAVIEKYSLGLRKNKVVVFSMDYYMNPDKYSTYFDEMYILPLFKDYLERISGCQISIVEDENRGEPMNPFVFKNK